VRNLLAKVPERERERVRKTYWQALDEATGEQDAKQRLTALVGELDRAGFTAAARCLSDDLDALVVHLRYPTRHRRRWRSTDESVKGRGPGWRRFAGVQSIGGRSRRGADRRIWPRFGVDRPGSGRSRACGGVAVGRGAFGAAVSGR
jgi:hypothetical protein